jgi:3',5'-cyclic AMP phosphodiesterase CpdA
MCSTILALVTACAVAQPEPTTRNAGSPTVCRIALVGDPHVSRLQRDAQFVLNFRAVIDQINASNVDVVLIAGDLMQSGNPDAAADFKEMTGRLKARCWFVPGNHDVGDKVLPTKPATVSDARVAQYEQWLGPAYFATEIAPGVRVIGIASSLFSSGTEREREQWEFIERELDRPRQGSTFLLTHYDPFAEQPDEPDAYFNMPIAARQRLLPLLKRGGVTAVLSAHLHRPIERDWEGIRVIGAPAVSFGLPEGKQPVGWKLVTLHADGTITTELHYLEMPATTRASPPATQELLR